MSNNQATEADRIAIRDMFKNLRGAPLDLKQHNPPGQDGFAAYGIITNSAEPVTLFLRGDVPANDFKTYLQFKTVEEMLDDGWVTM